HMVDALDGLREVQVFGLQSHRADLFAGLSARVRSIYFRLGLLNRMVSPVSEGLYVGLLLGLLLVGVAGVSSISSIAVFLLVLYRMQPQIRQFDSGRVSMAALASPVEAVSRFLHSSDDSCDAAHASMPSPALPEFKHNIAFDRVCFKYDSEREN